MLLLGFPGGTSGKEATCQCRKHKRHGFDPWVRKIPWRRAWQPTPVFLPEESHGQRGLAGYSPQGRKESDMTEAPEHTYMQQCYYLLFPGGLAGKESACNAGDLGSIPGLGRSPGEGNGYPLQYFSWKNSLHCIVHGVEKSRTWLSDFHFHFSVEAHVKDRTDLCAWIQSGGYLGSESQRTNRSLTSGLLGDQ